MDENSEDTPEGIKGTAAYLDLGLRLAVSVLLGIAGGYWLDVKLGTSPLLLIVGLAFGMTAGFLSLYRTVYPSRTRDNKT